MIGNYLADTNILVRLLRGDAATKARFAQMQGICLCTHVLGELYTGAYRSRRVAYHVAEVTSLLSSMLFVPSDRETAEEYGRLKAWLFTQGKTLPENDMWIAATALRHSLTLITADAHFDAIPQLAKERW